jgi:hypothetical protein
MQPLVHTFICVKKTFHVFRSSLYIFPTMLHTFLWRFNKYIAVKYFMSGYVPKFLETYCGLIIPLSSVPSLFFISNYIIEFHHYFYLKLLFCIGALSFATEISFIYKSVVSVFQRIGRML